MKNAICLLTFVFSVSSCLVAQTNTFPISGNVGVGTTNPGAKISFNDLNDGSNESDGITWYNLAPLNYGIYRTAGPWTHPNYQQIKINFLTGIVLNPGTEYNKSYVDVQGRGLRVTSGNVGIGTSVPVGLLEIKGPYAGNSQLTINTTHSNAELRFSENNTPKGFVWFVPNGDLLAFGRGSYSNSIVVNASGNVGVGTWNANEKLTVHGAIYGKEVRVDLAVPGPDYVFAEDYDLPSLKAVRDFISKNKHLPDVPSAVEMETNGIRLGEMNMVLLKKIEELTLYVLELQTKVEKQERQIQVLQSK